MVTKKGHNILCKRLIKCLRRRKGGKLWCGLAIILSVAGLSCIYLLNICRAGMTWKLRMEYFPALIKEWIYYYLYNICITIVMQYKITYTVVIGSPPHAILRSQFINQIVKTISVLSVGPILSASTGISVRIGLQYNNIYVYVRITF